MGVEQGSSPESPQDELYRKLFEHFKQVSPEVGLVFQVRLQELGILSKLEEIGVMPIEMQESPEQPGHQDSDVEEWWAVEERREEILKLLYIGAVLGRNVEDIFTPFDEPNPSD